MVKHPRIIIVLSVLVSFICLSIQIPAFAQIVSNNLNYNNPTDVGGIDLSQQDAALHVEKDVGMAPLQNTDGNEYEAIGPFVDPALIARVEREGMPEVVPVIINMRPADIRSLLGQ